MAAAKQASKLPLVYIHICYNAKLQESYSGDTRVLIEV